MILTKTPLRISLFGGGTDFENFYDKYDGVALSLAIDKYIYVIANPRFDEEIVVNYSIKEKVKDLKQLQHEIVREALVLNNISRNIEITTLSDIPTEGTGLGSSSTVTVGLLNAISLYTGVQKSTDQLFKEACLLEIDILKKPIGIQDQVIASYGGLGFFTFKSNRSITCERFPIEIKDQINFTNNFLLFYTNKTRKADKILSEQNNNTELNISKLLLIKEYAYKAREAITNGNYDLIGKMLHETWLIKKTLANGISNPEIDNMYQTAIESGALGGKIAGAGGGGFLLVYCPLDKQASCLAAMRDYKNLPFRLSQDGTKAILNIRD
jgi:D-glycero-alpha-D-manno-heptose-7-phosphate kinase